MRAFAPGSGLPPGACRQWPRQRHRHSSLPAATLWPQSPQLSAQEAARHWPPWATIVDAAEQQGSCSWARHCKQQNNISREACKQAVDAHQISSHKHNQEQQDTSSIACQQQLTLLSSSRPLGHHMRQPAQESTWTSGQSPQNSSNCKQLKIAASAHRPLAIHTVTSTRSRACQGTADALTLLMASAFSKAHSTALESFFSPSTGGGATSPSSGCWPLQQSSLGLGSRQHCWPQHRTGCTRIGQTSL